MTTLGKYELHEILGRGGSGTVYRAIDTSLNREVALKVLHPNQSNESELIDRFRNEARLVASLHNPHVTTIYEVGESEGRVFIAMEYLTGGSLKDKIERGVPISENEAIEIIRQVCSGLQSAHARNIVHRDIKPSNILLDGKGNALISDFGSAQIPLSHTDTDSFLRNHPGTAEYMPPEQRPGNYLPLRASADVYALGCVLFELLSKRPYFNFEGKRVKNLRVNTPFWLEKVVANAVNPDPLKRYPDAGELQKALQKRGRKFWINFLLIMMIGLSLLGLEKLTDSPVRLLSPKVQTLDLFANITPTPVLTDILINTELSGSTSTKTPTKTTTIVKKTTNESMLTKTHTPIPTKTAVYQTGSTDLPDLIVNSVFGLANSSFSNGNTYYSTICATIQNNGNSESGPFSVVLYNGEAIIDYDSIGSSKYYTKCAQFTHYFHSVPFCEYVTAVADYTHHVQEVNENNNRGEGRICINQ